MRKYRLIALQTSADCVAILCHSLTTTCTGFVCSQHNPETWHKGLCLISQHSFLNMLTLPAGLTAHSRPGVAFPILVAIIACQGLCLGLAAAYRPFVSAFLNFLEVTCGALDVATLVITAVVYKHKQERQASGAVPGQGDGGFAKVSLQLLKAGADSSPAAATCSGGKVAHHAQLQVTMISVLIKSAPAGCLYHFS